MTGEEEEETTPAQTETAENVPPIEDYLVTIEITPENFNDYFEIITFPYLDEWGEPVDNVNYFGLKCNLIDQGLIYYRDASSNADDDFLMELKLIYYTDWGELSDDTFNVSAHDLYDSWCFDGLDIAVMDYEKEITAEVLRSRGTLTFLKEEYIQEVTYSSTYKSLGYDVTTETLLLKNGEEMSIKYFPGRKY